jgi:hypothetical protein
VKLGALRDICRCVGSRAKFPGGPFGRAASSSLIPISKSSIIGAAPTLRDDLMQVSILRRINRSDIRRYFVAADCVLKNTAVRIVESAAWRGLTFPIDTRTCRIELQNGIFFQCGKDLEGNPVYYFQNTLIGPWRKDEDAVIAAVLYRLAAVLHRLETSLNEFAREDPEVKCTLIVSMGKPFRRDKKKQKVENGSSTTGEASTETGIGDADTLSREAEEGVENSESTVKRSSTTKTPLRNALRRAAPLATPELTQTSSGIHIPPSNSSDL